MQASVTALAQLDGVASVTSPFENPALVSADGATALANVAYLQPFEDLPDNGVAAFDALSDSVAAWRSPGLEIELGGSLPGSQPIDINPVLVLYGLLAVFGMGHVPILKHLLESSGAFCYESPLGYLR